MYVLHVLQQNVEILQREQPPPQRLVEQQDRRRVAYVVFDDGSYGKRNVSYDAYLLISIRDILDGITHLRSF